MADGTLKVGTITTSSGSGNITIGSGVTLQSNVPALKVTLTGVNQSGLTSATYNKVQFNTNDTGVTETGTWDASNYRWTPAVAANYFLSLNLDITSDSDTAKQAIAVIYKNGTGIVSGRINMNAFDLRSAGSNIINCAVIDTANITDYYEAYAYMQTNSGTFSVRGLGYTDTTNFSAYRIGA